MRITAIVFCLFISINALAQSEGKVRKDTSTHFMIVDARPIGKNDKPLYVVDGKIYHGNIKRINPDNILKVDVLKQPESIKLYGKQGANGVILISTKSHKNTIAIKKNDTAFSKLPDSAMYVVDGIVSDKQPDRIDPANILSLDILTESKASEVFGGSPKNGFVIVVTKLGAIKSYQKKLSAFSKEYEEYIEQKMKYNQSDSGLLYIIIEKNGDIASPKGDELIRKLYTIPADSIDGVWLNRKETCCGTNIFVTISIKQ